MSDPTPVPPTEEAKKRLREKVDKLLARDPCRSEASIVLNGSTLKYRAVAEFIPVAAGGVDDKRGEPEAAVFTTSYFHDDADPAARPVCFVFNGGPGSASIWLHFGLVGPKLIDIPRDASDPGAPPYRLRDNPWTILRATDLVMVDPVGTGFSKALGERKDEEFWGYEEDADSVAEFIRTFVTMKNRWNSPKYILGESYGGMRSGAVAYVLLDRHNVALNGVILVSPYMDFVAGNAH